MEQDCVADWREEILELNDDNSDNDNSDVNSDSDKLTGDLVIL